MNWRRLMAPPSSNLGPHIITRLRKDASVHHSKNCALMSQMGSGAPNWCHSQHFTALPCPQMRGDLLRRTPPVSF
jgi:hypothetical protein